MAHIYVHYENSVSAPAYTLKVAVGPGITTVADALKRFASAYGATGYEFGAAELTLHDESFNALSADAVLPCGLPLGADAFVRSSVPPTALSADSAPIAAAAAAAAVAAAARPVEAVMPTGGMGGMGAAPAEEARQQAGVYAKAGSAIAASQAKMGSNSYYYSVGKNRAPPPATVVKPHAPVPSSTPAPQPVPKAVAAAATTLPEQTFPKFAMEELKECVKVHLDLAGAGGLPDGAIACTFRERSFDLRVTLAAEHKTMRLHVPITDQLLLPETSLVKKRAGKLIVILMKADQEKTWYELRKTKGVGDTEYNKLVPDDGDPTEFKL